MKVIEKAQIECIKKIALKLKPAEDFTKHANLWLSTTTWSGPCTSWYKSGTDTKSAPMFPGTRTLFLKTLEADPRYEHYDIEYASGNTWNFLGNGLHVADVTGVSCPNSVPLDVYCLMLSIVQRDLTWYWGLIDGQDKEVAPFDWNGFLKQGEKNAEVSSAES